MTRLADLKGAGAEVVSRTSPSVAGPSSSTARWDDVHRGRSRRTPPKVSGRSVSHSGRGKGAVSAHPRQDLTWEGIRLGALRPSFRADPAALRRVRPLPAHASRWLDASG